MLPKSPRHTKQPTIEPAGNSEFLGHSFDIYCAKPPLNANYLYLVNYAECVIFSSEQCRGAADRAADAESPNVPTLPMSIKLGCRC